MKTQTINETTPYFLNSNSNDNNNNTLTLEETHRILQTLGKYSERKLIQKILQEALLE
jgi:hypothetical protein